MRKKTPLAHAYSRFRFAFIATMVFSFFINLLMFVGPLYMLQIYDRVLASRNELTLLMLSAIAVALLISYGLLEFLRSKLLVRAGLRFDEVIASPVFGRVVRQQCANPNGGSHVALSDIDKIREFMTGQGVFAFFDAPWVPIFLALCFAFHPWLGYVATTGAVVILILALINEFSTRTTLSEAGEASQGASHFLTATMRNAEVIRAMGMERQLADRWLGQHDNVLNKQASASGRAGAVVAASKFVRMSLQVAILGVGAYLAIGQQISPGIMIAASIVMGRALAPVEQAVAQWKQFVGARQAHKRLHAMFDSIGDEPERLTLPDPKGQISVSNLFGNAAGSRNTVLKAVSFGLEAGETMALIGPSGSGKSTLVRHLVGASVPVNGAIRLDGTELQHWGVEQLGQNLGYLPQDVRLFRGSVAENIARFQDDVADEEIVAAAKLAGAHEMIQTLPDGYDTNVGDDGSNVSGGQRQRIGLARAVFRTPPFIVLDEPNANLDAPGEEALISCLKDLKAMGKTLIVVTHKANLLTLSDKVLMLNGGTVDKFLPTQELFAAANTAAQAQASGAGAAPQAPSGGQVAAQAGAAQSTAGAQPPVAAPSDGAPAAPTAPNKPVKRPPPQVVNMIAKP